MEALMNAVQIQHYGSPSVLRMVAVKIPTPAEDEILVKVKACVATTADTIMRKGTPYFSRLFLGLRRPKKSIPGTGFAGIVVGKGEKVEEFEIGTRVFGETLLNFGANAEYLVIKESGVVLPMPQAMNYAEGATFCDGFLTSLNFLQEIGEIQSGDEVLINGAAGSLGTAAVQIAREKGAVVTAVSSSKNHGLLLKLGATKVIDYHQADFTTENKHYDIVFDTVAKAGFKRSKKVLTATGKYLTPDFKFGEVGAMLFRKKQMKFGATGLKKTPDLLRLLKELKEMYEDGKLEPIIDRQYPLNKLSEAHAYIETGHKKGNVIIQIED